MNSQEEKKTENKEIVEESCKMMLELSNNSTEKMIKSMQQNEENRLMYQILQNNHFNMHEAVAQFRIVQQALALAKAPADGLQDLM